MSSVRATGRGWPFSEWPCAVRRPLARLFPQKPWIWDRPVRYGLARIALAILDRWWTAGLDRTWTVPFAGKGKLFCGLRDIKDRVILMHGFSEYKVARLMFNLVQSDWVCVDVGANSGEYSVLFALLAPAGHIYAFEPALQMYARLQANIRLNRLSRVTIENVAVGQTDGTCILYVDPSQENTGLSSLSPSSGPDTAVVIEQPVRCVTLNTYLAEAGRVDLIKIDVEGHELDVLRGAERILQEWRPIIVFECGSLAEGPGCASLEHLRGLDYRIHCISYDVHHGARLVECDAMDVGTISRFYRRNEPLNLVALPAVPRGG